MNKIYSLCQNNSISKKCFSKIQNSSGKERSAGPGPGGNDVLYLPNLQEVLGLRPTLKALVVSQCNWKVI